MQNKDIQIVFSNANLLCSVESVPFKIVRRVKDLGKIAESVYLKLKEITELGAEKNTPEEEIEAERKEFLEKEVEVQFDRCSLQWFDDIPNVSIPYTMGDKVERFANAHGIIDFLIEKRFIV
jgi:hypothetical protein